ncbi:hypothetical protein PIB30_018316 [Stylosanthes scabra]|uniref:Ribonuclease H1 N-terminal domain-containing protein n=1 Tax=Stylosanthes scabra TaxID=79078 RepID=A0ABU6Z682_9FABA|nr:hypothetical protein [Stylosanthes scabra]
MEPSMNQFSHFAVTKGFRPGVYSSFDEANRQIANFPEPEYQGYNSLLLANNAFEERMFCIQSDMEAVAEQLQAMGITNCSPPTPPRTFPVGEGRLAPLVGGNPVERGLRAKGRFSPIEDDAKDDAAFSMHHVLMRRTGREIRDFKLSLCKTSGGGKFQSTPAT